MAAIPWTTVEDALATWIISASELTDQDVIWADQAGGRPPSTYVTMSLLDEGGVGTDWLDRERSPLVLADDDVESISGDTLTLTAHLYLTGDGPFQLTTTGTLPLGLSLLTDYWIIKRPGANEIRLATSLANANAGTQVTLSSAGTGTITISDTADTLRVGQEAIVRARGARTALFSIQVLAADATDLRRSLAILSDIRASMLLHVADLHAAGIGVLSMSRARAIGTTDSGAFEPRGVMDVTLSLRSEVQAFRGTIERVEVTNQVPETPRVFEVSLDDV